MPVALNIMLDYNDFSLGLMCQDRPHAALECFEAHEKTPRPAKERQYSKQ
jgi:hypothetical protein